MDRILEPLLVDKGVLGVLVAGVEVTLPPPQPATNARAVSKIDAKVIDTNFGDAKTWRTESSGSSLDVIRFQALRKHGGNVSPAIVGAHVAASLEHEAGVLDVQRTMPIMLGLRLQSGGVLRKIRAEDLLHVGDELPMPGDGKHISIGGDILINHSAAGRLDLMNVVIGRLSHIQAGIHVGAIGLDGIRVAS
jgi:hypothetical protein